LQPLFEPSDVVADQTDKGGENLLEAVMSDWRDTMVDRPEPDDGAAYVAGWTISGIAVLATIVTVWVLGI
jgi:hypothetical protein